MSKKIFLMIALLVSSIQIFAASCSGSSDFEKKSGKLINYWDLRAGANKEDWIVENWWIHSNATTDVFPPETKLVVHFYPTYVSCDFAVEAGILKIYVHKKPDPESLPEKGAQDLSSMFFKTPQIMHQPIGPDKEISHCDTTAGAPTHCSWHWEK